MKTARFADVVKASGSPETHLLWTPVADDKAFQRALKEHRIMTLHQELRGSKRDYGQVGFHKEPNAQFLLFPKSLRRFEGRRIIGIDYALFAQSSRATARPSKAPSKRKVVSLKSRQGSKHSDREETNVLKFTAAETPASTDLQKKSDDASSKPNVSREKVATPGEEKPPRNARPSKPVKDLIRESKTGVREFMATRRFVAEIEKAMRELRAGKSVLAYERLATLVRAARGESVA